MQPISPMDVLVPVATGINYGTVASECKRMEDSVHAGGNAYMTGALQLAQAGISIEMVDLALKSAEMDTIPWPVRWLVYLTPVVLAVVVKLGIDDDIARNIAVFAQDHFTNLCHLAMAVSSVAMIYFGSIALGAATLTTLGIGVLDRTGILPEQVRQVLHEVNSPLIIATGLFVGSGLQVFFSVVNLVIYAAQKYFAWTYQDETAAINRQFDNRTYEEMQGVLSVDVLRGILDESAHTEMNRNYIRYSTTPLAPDEDITEITQMMRSIDWTHNIGVLRAKLAQDQRYREREGDPSHRSDAELIAFAERSLDAFIHSVRDHRVLQGEPRDYQKLHNYLKLITMFLKNEKNEVLKIDAILRLAVEGGEYCGPGKFEVAESVFASFVGESEDIPVRLKVLNCEQDVRNELFEQLYQSILEMYNRTPIGVIIDFNDVHVYNSFRNLYGENFGLRKAGADNDSAAEVEPMLRYMYSWLINAVTEEFWNNHHVFHATETIVDAIGTSKLPKTDVYAWWAEWIERQPISDEEKDNLTNELSSGSLFRVPLEVADGSVRPRFDRRFVKAMLLDMGVLNASATVVTI